MSSHIVITPFKLATVEKTKAVSETIIELDTQIQAFSRVQITSFKFMQVYDEETYEQTQWPFTQTWNDFKIENRQIRQAISANVPGLGGASLGHAAQMELKALDELPHLVELEIVNRSSRRNNITLAESHNQYSSNDTEKEYASHEVRKITRMLTYSTDLSFDIDEGGFRGSISCSMGGMGSFNLSGNNLNTKYTLHVSFYNFKNQAMSVCPSVELGLLFT